jgi:hypothetical protein
LPDETDVCGDGVDQDCDGVADGCCLGDGSFSGAATYGVGSMPWAAAAGDFDADGILDLAVTNSNGDNVSVLLGSGSGGRGDGTFTPANPYQTGQDPAGVAVADFDSDGILDLVVADSGGNTVSVLLGNGSGGRGDGTFAPATTYPTADAPWSVAIGDFDSDGILDLAVPCVVDESISVLLGDGSDGRGDGTFGPKSDYPASAMPMVVVCGDFNTDAILDLAVANSSDATISVLLGNGAEGRGDGTFAVQDLYTVGAAPQDLAYGDFDSDGILDLVVVNNSDATISVLLGNGTGGRGDGTFSPRVDYAVTGRPVSVVIADTNADAILDLVVADSVNGRVHVLPGQGDGTFGTRSEYPAVAGVRDVLARDFNSDGIPDLALAGESCDCVGVLFGRGSGARSAGWLLPRMDTPTGQHPALAAAGDFNADGIADLAVAGSDVNAVSIHLGGGDGAFQAPRAFSVGTDPWMVATGDFDTDGILDLVVGNQLSGDVSVLIGDGADGQGDGSFLDAVSYTVADYPSSMVVGDFDSDGIQDLVVIGMTATSVLLGNGSEGRGDGTFADKVDSPGGGLSLGIVASDFDADGILDVAMPVLGGSVLIRAGGGSDGRGDGTFGAGTSYPTGNGAAAVSAGDFDADGILDLAVVNLYDDTVSVLPGGGNDGRGDGTFGPGTDYPVGEFPYAVIAIDLDDDNILDLAVSNNHESFISVLVGNGTDGKGDGTFADAVSVNVGSHPWGLVGADFNQDSVVDLAVVNGFADSFSVLLGDRLCLPSE